MTLMIAHSKKIDFLVIIVLLFVAAIVSVSFRLQNTFTAIIYLGIPSLYLFIREKKNYKKIFWGVLLFGVIFGTVFDFLMTINSAWAVPRPAISWLLFGVWPVDDILGYAFMTLFVLVFYEHFLDNERHRRLSKRHSKILFLSLLALALVIFIYTLNPSALYMPYPYLLGGLVAIIFPITFGVFKPKIISKFAVLAVFFFFVWLLIEIVGVRIGGWIYPGKQYIGWVSLFGLTFPVEEMIFWMLWHPATIVAYYEYFIDDAE